MWFKKSFAESDLFSIGFLFKHIRQIRDERRWDAINLIGSVLCSL
jgi:hypothetical protein